MSMFNPAHPGEILKEDVFAALGMSVTEAASKLKVSRVTLSRVLHEHASISPDMAVRLERAGISTARFWMALQSKYDLWQAEHRDQPAVERLVAPA
ncbi:HigA family addiction module antitoxin [uncultured Kushneria sp.]|uniref:HigA family addiction module antitoxin n=1 Tax=uncultured Kushneria sp. TaxID=905033 RepID=UPI002614EA91|nr:HigA family addiction module antitoxin [uncultured Kushneria sp.]